MTQELKEKSEELMRKQMTEKVDPKNEPDLSVIMEESKIEPPSLNSKPKAKKEDVSGISKELIQKVLNPNGAEGYAQPESFKNIKEAGLSQSQIEAQIRLGNMEDESLSSKVYDGEKKAEVKRPSYKRPTKTYNFNTPVKREKSKFNFGKSFAIELPSKGRFYQDAEDEDLRHGILNIYPMTIADEEILTNDSYINSGKVYMAIFESCMATNYPASKILAFDAAFIMYALRRLSYAEDYKFAEYCPVCHKISTYKINMTQIDWTELPEDAKEFEEVHFPGCGATAVFKINTLADDAEIYRLKKLDKYVGVRDDIIKCIASTAEITLEDGEVVNPEDYLDFYTAITPKDRNEILKIHVFETSEPKISMECPECQSEVKLDVPVNEDFFRVG